MKPSAAGFTLLEMIVVLAIAALIIGIGAGAARQISEDHALRRAAYDAEGILMQAMTRTQATAQTQNVALEDLSGGFQLTVRRAGTAEFVAVKNQRLLLRPGGLCEPLTLRWQRGTDWISTTLDPLTATLADTEDNL
ncbi:prepilin-type N-terminal cleavage/methylation domain-containing protein [Prosthecobacter sp.]|uniref:pilus assembly FimT family protein n=1 Tax=Prosthecobacter sp. TaxID=1965333 RepID=UPI001D516B3B|nr:prepilin-type N-terminal cleavage/methylation domain-containing protein [Prosthecobacter sp.]MCB1278632.1 prepilin-type N-terminal cleavage/methylation domain-containing protein [Prosthecobacter sp.]